MRACEVAVQDLGPSIERLLWRRESDPVWGGPFPPCRPHISCWGSPGTGETPRGTEGKWHIQALSE